MPEEGEAWVSRAEIARLAEVHRPAVANWERRYPDFPHPVGSVGGVERFQTAEVVAWLEARQIPRNARSANEPEGSSYADRVRRNLRSPTDATGADPHSLLRLLSESGRGDVFRDVLTVEEYRNLLLTLLHCAARRPAEWSGLVAAVSQPGGWLLDSLQDVLGRTRSGLPDAIFGATPHSAQLEAIRVLIQMMDVEAGDSPEVRSARIRCAFNGILERFVERTGKRADDLLTPFSITRLSARILRATGDATSFYDPYCRSGEFLAAVAAEAVSAGHEPTALRADGMHPRAANCRLAEMQLDLLGVAWNVQAELGLVRVQPRAGGYDLAVCNPPFNMRLDEQVVWSHPWRYGTPSARNGNFAWLQHILSALHERGRAAVVVGNNATFSASAQDRRIRAAMVEDGVIACLVALPPHLFVGTAVPATLWVLDNQRRHAEEVLFVDATSVGTMTSRTSRTLTEHELSTLVETFTRWWHSAPGSPFEEPGARRVPVSEIRERDYSLNPTSYIEAPASFSVVEVVPEQVAPLTTELHQLRGDAKEAGHRSAGILAGLKSDRRADSGTRTRRALIGDVPGDWEQLPLGQLADIQSGPHVRRVSDEDAGRPVVQPRDLREGWISEVGVESAVLAVPGRADRYALEPGDILCVRTGELGRHGLVAVGQRDWFFGTGLLRIRPRRQIRPDFLSHYLGLLQVREWIRRHATGTAVPSIPGRVLAELPVLLPPADVQERIGHALEVVRDEARIHDSLARASLRMRDTLAPLLMTGTLPL